MTAAGRFRQRSFLARRLLEQPGSPASGYDPASYARLQAIRRRVDPTGLLRANHEVLVPAEVAS